MSVLDTTVRDVFKTPPIEWVGERLEQVQEVLERETTQSALLLRRILGPIRLTPATRTTKPKPPFRS